MKRLSRLSFAILLAAATCAMLGCPPASESDSGDGADDSSAEATDGETADGEQSEGEASDGATADADAASHTDVTSQDFTADTAMIQFVGVHTDPEKPDPRTGTFEAFTGIAAHKDGKLDSVTVDIETPSLTTEIDKLTTHLKSADFFNVNEYPTAKFASTSIEEAGDGKVNVTGDLTLLGETKSITFPATVSMEDGLKFDATFTIDRTEFGMNYGEENIKKEVEMTVKIPK